MRGSGRGRGRGRDGGRGQASDSLPPIKKPNSVIGKQIGVLGSFWSGRMSAAERATTYLCTVRKFDAIHKWDTTGSGTLPPSSAWELQEMGESGTGSLEEGDASGEIFWMNNKDFLSFYYKTFPEELPARDEEAAGRRNKQVNEEPFVDVSNGDEVLGGDNQEQSTSASPFATKQEPSSAALVYKFWNLASDTLIQLGKDSGKYKAKYTCAITNEDGSVCGAVRTITHAFGKYGINSNLHSHISGTASMGCPNHHAALKELEEVNPARTKDEDGNSVLKMNFAEAFHHHVHATLMRCAGALSMRMPGVYMLYTDVV